MAIQNFFPCNPSTMDWQTWDGNLIRYVSEERIGVTGRADWMITAKNVSQLPTFEAYPVPDPDLYQNWQDWAADFTLIVNGPSQ